ncbi:ABC transporter substrate-binding protein [Pseudonocardia ailaonensis]|uniref:ABC transporter substrate-binding protein n=1 Tax=Pseudonocardia ailaonensis TaxID=367279 RepID=A0ABN2NPA3_9PSEU
MRRTRLFVGAAAALLALVAACGGGGSPAPAASGAGGSPVPVTMTSFNGSFASLSVYVANRKGFFAQHGIAPNFVTVTSGSAAMQAMLSGSADMANVAIFEALTAAAKGEDVKYIVGAATGSFGELVVGKNVPLAHEQAGYPAVIQDLKGKKIGVSSKGSATYYGLAYVLQQAGLNPDTDVTIVPAGALSAQVAALDSGQLDAFMSQEPVTTQVTTSGDGRVVFYQYQGNRPPLLDNLITNGISTTDKYLAANPAAVKGVHDAVAQADEFIAGLDQAGATDLADVVSPDFPGIDKPVLAQAIEHYQKLYSATMTKAGVDAANQLLIENGVLKTPVAYGDVVSAEAQSQ